MNYFGSYRRLRDNAKSAITAGIEVYNKPRFPYRDEVFVILLLNAWELLIKAILSKKRVSIYYAKRPNEPYRTLGLTDACNRAVKEKVWPVKIQHEAVFANLQQLAVYRDAAVHFYNAPGFEVLIYSLSQTAITNFRDVLRESFGHELADEIGWRILPLGTEPPIDPIAYLRGAREGGRESQTAVSRFLRELQERVRWLDEVGVSTDRLLTIHDVSLKSVKKVEYADVVIGVDSSIGGGDPIVIERRTDPKLSHPFRQKQVLEAVGELHGKPLTSWDFYAVREYLDLGAQEHLCYRDEEVGLTRWAREVVPLIKSLPLDELEAARIARRASLRERRQQRSQQ
ncbi:MAG: DUF3644 domain-containing protein [Chloroflexi bacterium]|nr:DUF3644 domain-containing protein [Chloroflexota bacterium]